MHFTRNIIAGIVVLLPLAGTVFTVVYLEDAISSSWLAKQPFYFPGFGLLITVVLVYVVGLIASTVAGRWAWRRVDNLLKRIPALGVFYQTLKQLLGYGEGEGAVFKQVVMVPEKEQGGYEFGLVTNRRGEELTVFVPSAPNPTTGRVLVIPASEVRTTDISVGDLMRYLVSLGKTPLQRP
jgi:uncharacterized membrane protein